MAIRGMSSIYYATFIYLFHPIWVLGPAGVGGGAAKGLLHNLLTQLFAPSSSKVKVFKTYFFDIVTTQNDHPTHVQHVLGRKNVVFTLFGY